MVIKRLLHPAVWLTAWVLLCSTGLQAATITAKTDRMNITLDENFNLMFVIEGDIDKAPDFSPLKKDFDILGQSQGSTTTISNGYYKTATTYSLTLMAKRAGNLIIPAIAFGKDSSQVLALSVGAGSSNAADQQANLLLEATPSLSTTWVQGQIILSVKLLSALNLRTYNVSSIDIGKFDASIEELGEAKQSQTTRDGRNYLMIEQKFAIHPQQAGKLTIEPLVAEVNAITQSRSMFDPFNMRGNILRARSRSITINVQDIPAEFTGKLWLPASELQLVEEWAPNPPVFKVGEPVTRTLNLFADGLTAAQLPPLMGADLDGIKQYPDQPVLNNAKSANGIIGGRREKIALLPMRAGNFTLPAIEVTWWNSKTGHTEVARLPEKIIKVLPGSASATTAVITDEALPAMTDANSELPTPVAPHQVSNIYAWLSLFFASGWFITAASWWYSRSGKNIKRRARKAPKISASSAKAAVHKACANNQAQPCRAALIDWARLALAADIHSLGDIIRQPSVQQHNALVQELEHLNASLYRSKTSSWRGQNLWQQIQLIADTQATAGAISAAGLQPLYK